MGSAWTRHAVCVLAFMRSRATFVNCIYVKVKCSRYRPGCGPEALEGVEWSAARAGRTLPRERPGTHCTGGWVVNCIYTTKI